MAQVRFRLLSGVLVMLMGAAACDSDNPASPNPDPTAAAVTLASLTVASAEVEGGAAVQGTATLSAAAPAGGTPVSLSSSSVAATVPGSITVPAGATSATFAIATTEVTEVTTVTILGSSGGANRSATLRVRAADDPDTPSEPVTIQARNDDLVGGTDSSATITLASPAPSGGLALRVSSDDKAVEVPAQFTIAAGSKSGTFKIRTKPVATARTATITVTGDVPGLAGARRTTAALTVMVTVKIRLLPAGNDPPTATDDSYALNEDAVLTVAAPGVLGNDTDPESATLTADLVTDVGEGALALNANGSFTYTPDADFDGTATFTYRASDGNAGSNTATVTISVTGSNDAPTITDIADETIDEDTPTGALTFTVDDAETAEDSLTLSGSSSDTTLVPDANIVFGGSGADRTVTVTPAANQFGQAVITVTVSDGSLSAVDTFELTVSSVNDAPTISHIPSQDLDLAVDNNTGWIPYSVSDVDTPVEELEVSSSLSDATGNVLIARTSVFLAGSGSNSLVTVRYNNLHQGTVTVGITVSDGIDSTTQTFIVFILVGGLLSGAVPRRRRRE